MKRKTKQVEDFINGLHNGITSDRQFRRNTAGKSESQIQAELRPLIISYLEKYFSEKGYKDSTRKANDSFYWEGQEGKHGRIRDEVFGARNYPDFIITAPYLVAVEYKQSANGSTVKQGIGQSIMHTMTEDFHYVYYLFHDQSKGGRVKRSLENEKEKYIANRIWSDFNVMIKIVERNKKNTK